MQPKTFITSKNTPVLYLGPDISQGKMATVFYFVTSGEEALTHHPYNTPVEALLASQKVRVFSFDIPGHGIGLDSRNAIALWAAAIAEGRDPLTSFFEATAHTIQEICRDLNVAEQPIGLMGLSRGAFVATHLGARLHLPLSIVGYAPLTDLHVLDEFHRFGTAHPVVEALQLKKTIPSLIRKPLCFSIGNHDMRVGTSHCYSFIHDLVKHSVAEGIRSPEVELSIVPSIGMAGHGTSPQSFAKGAAWMLHKLGQQ